MKNFLQISPKIIAEDLRKYWIIPVLGTLAYFMVAVFPILMKYDRLYNMGEYLTNLLHHGSPLHIVAAVITPVITALVLFSYLYSISGTALIHSLPFKRSTLYNSHFVSGIIMSILPALICGVMMLLIHKPVEVPTHDALKGLFYDAFAISDIIAWIWQTAIIILIVFAIMAFASTITGNLLGNVLVAGLLMAAPSMILSIFPSYFTKFLYGASYSPSFQAFASALSPLWTTNGTQKPMTTGWLIWYATLILLCFVGGSLVYNKRPLERAASSIVFKPIRLLTSYLVTFVGMSFIGFYNGPSTYNKFFFGAVISFMAVEMILSKTFKIFNEITYKRFAVYFAIVAVFFLAQEFDVTGYENKIPDISDVKSVYITEASTGTQGNLEPGYMTLVTEANKEAAINLHQYFLKNKAEGAAMSWEKLNELLAQRNEMIASSVPPELYIQLQQNIALSNIITFDYTLSNGTHLTRSYLATDPLDQVSDDYVAIKSSREYRSNLPILHADIPKSEAMTLSSHMQTISVYRNQGLFDAVARDLFAISYKDLKHAENPLATLTFWASPPDIPTSNNTHGLNVVASSPDSVYYQVNVTDKFTNTIKWLKENKLYERLLINPSVVSYIAIQKVDPSKGALIPILGDFTVVPVATPDLMVITDTNRIRDIMEDSEPLPSSFPDMYYQVDIIFLPLSDATDEPQTMLQGQNLTKCFTYTVPADIAAYFKAEEEEELP